MTREVQIQLHKDEQKSKNRQGSKDEQRGEETGVEEANKTKDEQRGEEIGVEEANELDEPSESSDKLDKPSESSVSDCLFVPTV